MADLASALLGSDDVAGATAKQIADLVKEEDVRNRIGAQAAVYTGLVSLVSRSSKPSFAKQQALRAIGNLCFDHDDNRARFAAAGGVSAIIGALEALQVAGGRGCSPEDRVLCAGAILNTIAGNLDLAGRFVAGGVIKGLIWLIRTAQSHREKELAFGSISHLAMCPGALAQMSGAGICPLLVDELLSSEGSDSTDDVIELLRSGKAGPLPCRATATASVDVLPADFQERGNIQRNNVSRSIHCHAVRHGTSPHRNCHCKHGHMQRNATRTMQRSTCTRGNGRRAAGTVPSCNELARAAVAVIPEAAGHFESAEMDRKLRVLAADGNRPEVVQVRHACSCASVRVRRWIHGSGPSALPSAAMWLSPYPVVYDLCSLRPSDSVVVA